MLPNNLAVCGFYSMLISLVFCPVYVDEFVISH